MEPRTIRRLVVGCGAALGALALVLVFTRGNEPVPLVGAPHSGTTGPAAAPPTRTSRPAPVDDGATPSVSESASPSATESSRTAQPTRTPVMRASTSPDPGTSPTSQSTPPIHGPEAPPRTPRPASPSASPTPSDSASPRTTPTPTGSPSPTATPSVDPIERYRVTIDDPRLNDVCNTERSTFRLTWSAVAPANHYKVSVSGTGLSRTSAPQTNSEELPCPTATGEVTFTVVGEDATGVRQSEVGTLTVNFQAPMGGLAHSLTDRP